MRYNHAAPASGEKRPARRRLDSGAPPNVAGMDFYDAALPIGGYCSQVQVAFAPIRIPTAAWFQRATSSAEKPNTKGERKIQTPSAKSTPSSHIPRWYTAQPASAITQVPRTYELMAAIPVRLPYCRANGEMKSQAPNASMTQSCQCFLVMTHLLM